MTDNERVEYQGLAATVGRLMMSIKQLEANLVAALTERDEALAQVEAEPPAEARTPKKT